jgi:hypothetical protein
LFENAKEGDKENHLEISGCRKVKEGFEKWSGVKIHFSFSLV